MLGTMKIVAALAATSCVVTSFVGVAPAQAASSAPTVNVETPAAENNLTEFVPTTPVRVADTRTGRGIRSGQLAAGSSLRVPIAGVTGIPYDAKVVSINVTAVSPDADGSIVAYTSGAKKPALPTVSYAAGQVVSGHTLVTVGENGTVELSTSSDADVVVDVVGYFTADTTFMTSSGDLVVDTTSQVLPVGPVSQEVNLFAADDAPRQGLEAAILNVRVSGAGSDGYLTATRPGSQDKPSSQMTFSKGKDSSGLVVAEVSPDGKVLLGTNVAAHLEASVVGYIPRGSRFESMGSTRFLDTRDVSQGGPTRLEAGQEIIVDLSVVGIDFPPRPAAVAVTITAVDPANDGFLTLYPAGGARPNASAVNFAAGKTTTNSLMAPVNDEGKVAIYSHANTDVVLDVHGYYPATGDVSGTALDISDKQEFSFAVHDGSVWCDVLHDAGAHKVECETSMPTYNAPVRPEDCRLSWGHRVSMQPGRAPEFLCTAMTTARDATVTVQYGTTISGADGLQCDVTKQGVLCQFDTTGHRLLFASGHYDIV